ncbi:DUF732 domain-containing protein [Tsukamurella paurometabola]|uniref:DUF732 domain-containing protein n=1 Tax=Tsukamurella paurometabola TaxID=2061 RepID=A0ABS5NA39_TSUPA|nr:DUF732 domain-containing protein [Tsukamurella paurometabola]MBS4101109.1 DUF732 domain-containing protein [Tsukamurella paurometabola]
MPKLRSTLAAGIAALGIAALVQAPAHADGRLDEGRFLVATHNTHDFTRPHGYNTTDAQMLRFGYAACAQLDRHPTDPVAATQALYRQRTYPEWERQQVVFYAAQYLCNRHWDLYKSEPKPRG